MGIKMELDKNDIEILVKVLECNKNKQVVNICPNDFQLTERSFNNKVFELVENGYLQGVNFATGGEQEVYSAFTNYQTKVTSKGILAIRGYYKV